MPTLVLTGATGFVGRYLHRAFVAAGWRVVPVVRPGSESRLAVATSEAETIRCADVFSSPEGFWASCLSGVDCVVHAAWYVDHRDYLSSPENHRARTGSVRFARAALAAGVECFLGIGTCLEYAPSEAKLHVRSPCDPKSAYAKAKYGAYREISAMHATANSRFAWARIFFVYGEGEPETKLFSYVHSQLRAGRPVEIKSGASRRDFVEVSEAAEQIVRLVDDKHVGAANICSGRAQGIREWVESIADGYERGGTLNFVDSTETAPSVIAGWPGSHVPDSHVPDSHVPDSHVP